MTQMPMFSEPVWSVTQLTRYVRDIFEKDALLQDLWVQGEISNSSRPASGHLYFTLKDQASSLKCVMWRIAAARQTYLPRDGDAVEVHGTISVYEAAGQYQLYADSIRPIGLGNLFQEFIRLKNRLEAEGLFDQSHKRPIPTRPALIGVVTSPTGAAFRDIINTIRRRYPLVKLILSPSPVQGEEAPPGIVRALGLLNNSIHPNLIILARGGGSIEDLWAFNDERVARAIYESKAPVISGVGHETDFTIADFVSDLRAPTPTAAAEIATPAREDLIAELAGLLDRLNHSLQSKIDSINWQIGQLEHKLALLSPASQIRSDRQRLDDFDRRAAQALSYLVQMRRTRLKGIEQRLTSLSPSAILNRGYAIVSSAEGNIVRSVYQVSEGDLLQIEIHDGKFKVEVTNEKNR
jgi:exodeoxyribonuclease VII large subunit